MENLWKTFPVHIPTANTDCFVRLDYWFGTPFIARYNAASQNWTSNISGIVYPAWSISRWRYVN